jgi:thiamine biosynthesis lipoprotein
MGTFARVVCISADADTARKAIEAAFEQLDIIEDLMSGHKEDSQISRINRDAYKSPVKVSSTTFEVLQKAVEYSRLSNGAFDVTVGPLEELWHSAAEVNSTPADIELAGARAKVGYEKLILDANEMTVRFVVDGMKLDVGGIAKGYAIDAAVYAMQRCGALGGMVDVGGDIRCFGAPPKGNDTWRIGLQDPTETETVVGAGRYLLVLKLIDSAVATSGDYRRFVLVEGKKQSHILDTKTGYGSGKLSSVTIICPKAVDADALATAVSVMGREKGLGLIESLENTEAVLISAGPEYKIVTTGQAKQYIAEKKLF